MKTGLLLVLLLVATNVSGQQTSATGKKEATSLANKIQLPEDIYTGPAWSIMDKRLLSDQQALNNPYAISQHRQNYLLPVSYQTNPNQIGSDDFTQGRVDHLESRFQVSVKMPIFLDSPGKDLEGLYFGFSAMSNWQVYNSEVSKPFRETNYEPELFYIFHTDLDLFGFTFNTAQLGFNHQSNGQDQLRSRSWNRLFGSILFSDEDSAYYLKAWYRLPEDAKDSPLDPDGDDNPDITHYLGHFEFGYGTKLGAFNILALVRNNLKTSDNKGSLDLTLGYPISERYDLVLKYFNGYGDSLIDYNRHQQRFSIGVQLAFF
ncbi:Phospholipase A(1) [Saliniradius amylolyticus]|uniref:Phospholipase A1 n=1 Tax=Saliniradius amylolyticus TaxID=2183582 RepID=A0A2S2E7Z3_9ALTE|nr:phospholipase A [Saliniradius amylolyticus]AWL13067.1 Phospholipase A(1) [Saliniradius amylolyticus]